MDMTRHCICGHWLTTSKQSKAGSWAALLKGELQEYVINCCSLSQIVNCSIFGNCHGVMEVVKDHVKSI